MSTLILLLLSIFIRPAAKGILVSCDIPPQPKWNWVDIGVHQYQVVGQPTKLAQFHYEAEIENWACADTDGNRNEAFCEIFGDDGSWVYETKQLCTGDK